MYCRNCGEQMNDNQAICLKCGVATGTGDSFCQNCGSAVNPNQAVCLSCGVALKQPQQQQNTQTNSGDEWNSPKANLNGQTKLVMALLCFFLGGWGVHNFVMGETKKGIRQIILFLVCGISWIFALIDFIQILTDKYVAEPS